MTETKTCSKCGEDKSLSEYYRLHGKLRPHCKRCHSAQVCKRQSENKEARAEYMSKYYAENGEHLREQGRVYYAENKEAARQYSAKYRAENRERIADKAKAYYVDKGSAKAKARYEANKESILAIGRAWYNANKEYAAAWRKRWGETHPERVAATASKRRAAKRLRVPPWFDAAKVQEIYDLAQEFRDAGFDVHVDHIVPLQGEHLSGLHWHGNLRVCLAEVNLRKGPRMSEVHEPLACEATLAVFAA